MRIQQDHRMPSLAHPRRARRARQSRWLAGGACAALLLFVLALSACNTGVSQPTPTFVFPTVRPALAASPTVDPVAPIVEGEAIHDVPPNAPGVSNPAQAGLAAEGQPAQDLPTLTPPPTEVALPMMITGTDGLVLRGTLYSAPLRPAPGVLLLHERGTDQTAWTALANRLQAAGYIVLTIDLRGHGATGGSPDWTLAPGDVNAALSLLADVPGVNRAQIAVVGAAIGANLGLNACADYAGCAATVLLSPGLDLRGITSADALARLGVRAVLIISGENDENNPGDSITLDSLAQGDHQLVILPQSGRGTALLALEPALVEQIAGWLVVHVPPPVPAAP